MFEKYSSKYKAELSQLLVENDQTGFSSSNLENAVKKGMEIAHNLSQLWLSADFTNKQQLQYLIYPEGILYSKEMMQFELGSQTPFSPQYRQ